MITSAVSETTPPSRTRETLESALLKSPSPDHNNVSEKHSSFSVQSVDDKKTQLPLVTYVVDEKKTHDKSELEEQIDNRTELPLLVESKGTETEEDHLVGNESLVKSQGLIAADASAIEKDVTPEVEIASKVELDKSETGDVIIIRKETDEEVEEKLDESVIIIIQAAVRGFLVWSCYLLYSFMLGYEEAFFDSMNMSRNVNRFLNL